MRFKEAIWQLKAEENKAKRQSGIKSRLLCQTHQTV